MVDFEGRLVPGLRVRVPKQKDPPAPVDRRVRPTETARRITSTAANISTTNRTPTNSTIRSLTRTRTRVCTAKRSTTTSRFELTKSGRRAGRTVRRPFVLPHGRKVASRARQQQTYHTPEQFIEAAESPVRADRARAVGCVEVDEDRKRRLAEAAVSGEGPAAARQHDGPRYLVQLFGRPVDGSGRAGRRHHVHARRRRSVSPRSTSITAATRRRVRSIRGRKTSSTPRAMPTLKSPRAAKACASGVWRAQTRSRSTANSRSGRRRGGGSVSPHEQSSDDHRGPNCRGRQAHRHGQADRVGPHVGRAQEGRQRGRQAHNGHAVLKDPEFGGGHDVEFIDQVIREGAPDGANRSDLFHAIVGHLLGSGLDAAAIEKKLRQHPDGIAARYIAEDRLDREIARSAAKYSRARALPQFAGFAPIASAPTPRRLRSRSPRTPTTILRNRQRRASPMAHQEGPIHLLA